MSAGLGTWRLGRRAVAKRWPQECMDIGGIRKMDSVSNVFSTGLQQWQAVRRHDATCNMATPPVVRLALKANTGNGLQNRVSLSRVREHTSPYSFEIRGTAKKARFPGFRARCQMCCSLCRTSRAARLGAPFLAAVPHDTVGAKCRHIQKQT